MLDRDPPTLCTKNIAKQGNGAMIKSYFKFGMAEYIKKEKPANGQKILTETAMNLEKSKEPPKAY